MAHIVLHDEKAIMPSSAELCGEYGETGLFAGVPCVIGANGVEQVIELPLTAEELAQLSALDKNEPLIGKPETPELVEFSLTW